MFANGSIDFNSLSALMKCANFAAIKHRNQRRKDPAQTPYINHPIGVANILVNEGGVDDFETLLVFKLIIHSL